MVSKDRYLHVKKGQVDVIAAPRQLAMAKGRKYADGGIKTREDVGDGNANLRRSAARCVVGSAGNAHEATKPLHHEVVTRAVAIGASLAETGDRAIDKPGVDRRERAIVETILRQSSDLEVLDQDVRCPCELANGVLALRVGNVDRYRFLSPICREEIGRVAGGLASGVCCVGWTPASGIVSCAGPLDLNNLRAEVGQRLACPRTRQDPRKIEHANPVEWAAHRLRLSQLKACKPVCARPRMSACTSWVPS